MNESIRAVGLFLAILLSLLLFGFGLLAPLTPSEGLPALWEVLTFVGVPLVLCATALYVAKGTSERVFLSVVLILIAGATMRLFVLLLFGR
jgi:hypothetical protein